MMIMRLFFVAKWSAKVFVDLKDFFPNYFTHAPIVRIKWNVGLLARLPECYKKFYEEWQYGVRTPVHWIPHEREFERLPTGELKRYENHEIPAIYPKESHQGIWGGEGVIYGFEKRIRYKAKVPMFWVPFLKRSVLYSEVLNQHLSTVITERTEKLIDEHKGFDLYLLETPACDLQSELALKLKRFIYQALANKQLPYDEAKNAEILEKYKRFIIPREEAEWYGLTLREACEKLNHMEENVPPVPLKDIYRRDLLAMLKERRESGIDVEKSSQPSSMVSGLFSMLKGSLSTKS